MSATNITTVQDVYNQDPRGSMGVAYKLRVHIRTVDRWTKFGIPDSYWDRLQKLYGITPYELFRLNGKIRGYKTDVKATA